MRSVRARLLVLLAALIWVLPSGLLSSSQYFCRMMGRVVESCCCESEAQLASAAPELRLDDCCQRITSPNRSAAAATHRAVRVFPVAALAPSPPARFLARQTAQSCGSRGEYSGAPLALGPPLFLANCALLS